jgi:hypothetical protein
MNSQIEILKQHIIKYAESYLKEFGEFYPFGVTMDIKGSIKPFDTYFNDENPTSLKVIESLEKAYKTFLETNQREYEIISICLDVSVVHPNSGNKTDALEIRINYKPNQSINYYVPYKKNENGTIFFQKEYSEAGTLNIIGEQKNKVNLNQAVITSTYIIKEKLPILYVVHEDADEWQFLGGQNVEEKDIMLVSIQNIIDTDETITQILHLPLGSEAMRKDKKSEWRITIQN